MKNAIQYVSAPIQYKVVVNHEEQYSLWIDGRDNAPGWWDAGCSGPKDECLAFVRRQWTDMRPLSLRKTVRPESGAPPHHSKGTESSLAVVE